MENNEKAIKRIEEMQKTDIYHEETLHRFRRHIKVWLSRKTLSNRIVTFLLILGAMCGLMTYAALTNVPPFGTSSSGLIILLNVNLVILLTLLVLVSRRIITLYIRRRRGIVGSNLHIRLVFIFSLLAALPAMFMAFFSVGFFYFGLHGWLDDRVRTAINESQAVAEAYLAEHQQLIRADVLALAADLNRQVDILSDKPEAMQKMLRTQSLLRNFSNIFIFRPGQGVVFQAKEDGRLSLPSAYDTRDELLQSDDVVVMEDGQEGIQALLRLDSYPGLFIHAERAIDPKVLGHVERARQGVAQYQEIERSSTRLQIQLTAIYVLVTLLLTVAAIWFGLSFAKKLMSPITDLIRAAEKASGGDLSVRVDPSYAVDEFKMLGHAFNRMTKQIETQQHDLVSANTQMDFRRRFTETILGGVSTGVLSVNREKKITLANNAAGELLNMPIDNLLWQKISYVMPELSPYLEDALNCKELGAVTNCEIHVRRHDRAVRVFMARIVVEELDKRERGAVVTFDDLTAVLANQRKAAWADIARRIAHEIKNPLTPIQLSAERLNRKYAKNLEIKDKQVFEQSTETIIRHVNDIKRMVNSFAEFAKMPDADIKRENILPVIEEVVDFSQSIHPDIHIISDYEIEGHKELVVAHDSQQIRQVITNLIKNAVESFEQGTKADDTEKMVTVFCHVNNNSLFIGVADNGPGLPKDIDFEKLSEPYVTHKAKGTGLGLAIVKKIVEDHNGELLFNPDTLMINLGDISYSTLIGFTLPTEGIA